MKLKIAVAMLLCLLLSVVLAACGDSTPTSSPATSAASGGTGSQASTTSASSNAPVTLTYLVDDSQSTKDTANALIDGYKKTHPNVTIKLETRPQGTEGDNVVKTRLATGDMDDVFEYNSGSLLQALHPTDTLVDISKQPFMSNISDVFIPTVSQNGQTFGVPFGTASAGGILYNKKVFAQLGLSVPKTWAEFEANNDKIKAAGIAPVIQTYGDTWTSQLFVLGDYYNLAKAEPNFAADYTAGKVKIANDPTAMEGFTYLQEGFQKGWYEKDFATMKNEQGLKMLADGKGAQYPMLLGVLATIQQDSPSEVNDIGFFAQPGKDASQNGATVWMPAATYIPKTSKHVADAENFLAFIASQAGVDAINAKVPPTGPYVIKGATLPDTALPAVKDLAAYVNSGNSLSALEFYSPLKGPSLEQICVAVGSGQMSPQTGASNYDQDVKKEAQQLNLPGWN